MNLETSLIHADQNFSAETGAVIPPIFATSTFASGNAGGFDYTRSGNPNFRNLESQISTLENAEFTTVFSSGVAATTAIISSLRAGDLILGEENLYGCTLRLFEKVIRKFGVSAEYFDFSDEKNFTKIIEKKPKLVWIESPTNPLLKILDIRNIAEKCHEVGATLVVDNTFASPIFQKPLDRGADISLSSATKWIGGHSDALIGVVATNSAEWADKMVFAQKAVGLSPSPFDCWLVSRGAKTLPLRMEKHSENALAIAKFLESRPEVKWVRFPFLESHPQYDLARAQMSGGSGIVTVEFNFSAENTKAFLKSLKLFSLAESLGGVESLCCHPATMTHASVDPAVREEVGITDGVARFSVGIENAEDLISDLENAFSKFLFHITHSLSS